LSSISFDTRDLQEIEKCVYLNMCEKSIGIEKCKGVMWQVLVNQKNNASVMTVLFLVAVAIGLGLVFMTMRAGQSTTSGSQIGAWDCANYNFTVSQAGDVKVVNGSTRTEPMTKVNVYIDDVLVATPTAPALGAGQSATFAKVNVPANGAFRWRAVAVADTRCDDSGEYVAKVCKVAYLYANSVTSAGYPSTGAFITGSAVQSNLPAGAVYKPINLYSRTFTTNELSDVDVLVVGETGITLSTPALPASEMISDDEVAQVKAANASGMHIIAAADNRNDDVGLQNAGETAGRIVNAVQSGFYFRPDKAYVARATATTGTTPAWGPAVAMLSGMKIFTGSTTVAGLDSPSYLLKGSDVTGATCAYEQLVRGSTTTKICMVGFVAPSAARKGSVYIDGNAGYPTATAGKLKSLLEYGCANQSY
jgi:hypothetical protein